MTEKEKAIQTLKENPDLAKKFDELFGEGESQKYLQSTTLDSNETQTQENNEEDGVFKDVGKQIIGGVLDATKNTINLVENIGDSASNFMSEKTGLTGLYDSQGEGFIDKAFLTTEEAKEQGSEDFFFGKFNERDNLGQYIPDVPDADTMVGAFVRPTAQFLTSYLTGGKILKQVKPLTTGGKVTKGMVQGGFADFVAFDEHEARLSDMFEGTAFANPVADYLASDENDSYAEGRFKNFLEGMVLGGAIESVFAGFRGFKNRKKARLEGDEKAYKEVDAKETKILEETITKKKSNKKIIDEAQDNKINKKLNKDKKRKSKDAQELKSNLEDSNLTKDLALMKKNIAKWRNSEIDPATKKPWKLKDILDNAFASGTFARVNSDESIFVLNKVMENLRGLGKITDETKTNEEIIKVAEDLGKNPVKVVFDLARLADEMDGAETKALAGYIVQRGYSNNLYRISEAILNGTAKEEDFDNVFTLLEELTLANKNVSTGGSRILNASKINEGLKNVEEIIPAEDVQKWAKYKRASNEFKWLPSKKNKKILIKATAKLNDPHQRNTFLQKVLKVKNDFRFIAKLNEYWINAILSSPKTHAINMSSNAIMTLITPMEMIIGGSIRMNGSVIREGIDTYIGLYKYAMDSFRLLGHSVKENKNYLDETTKIDLPTKEAIGGVTGKIVRTPSRLLGAEDEFFKQINYRAKLYARAMQLTRVKLGDGKIKKAEFAEEVETIFATGFEKGDVKFGKGTNDYALAYAQDNTFTRGLSDKIKPQDGGKAFKRSSLGSIVQDTTNSHPALKQILPFVRTPVNILRTTWERTPLLNLAQREYREKIFNGLPHEKAQAWGKMAVGSVLYTTAVGLAVGGKISGGGSRDYQIRKQQIDAGWRPYSYKNSDGEWISYERLDPWGMFLGLTADFAELRHFISDEDADKLAYSMKALEMQKLFPDGMSSEEMSDEILETLNPDFDVPQYLFQGIASAGKNVVNKTYLKGISEILEAIQTGDTNNSRLLKYTQNKLGSFVPNIMKKMLNDPYYRELNGVMDGLKAGIPYFNETLEPKYDYKGEKSERTGTFLDNLANPFSTFKDEELLLEDEIARLNVRFPPPDSKMGGNGNIEMKDFKNSEGKSAFLEYNELIGTLKLGNNFESTTIKSEAKTLRQKLEETIQSDAYQNLEDTVSFDNQSYKGGKVAMLQNIISNYRKQAKKELKLKKEFKNDKGQSLNSANELNKSLLFQFKNMKTQGTSKEDYLFNYKN